MPDFEMILNKVQEFVQRDMDIPLAIERQALGQEIYQRSVKIKIGETEQWQLDTKVPSVYPPENGEETGLQVQELIKFGDKYSELENKNAQKAVGRNMFSLWFNEALFQSGFTHYDLHQGNFTVLVEDNNKVVLYILDYGMTIDIPKVVQRTFILFAIGAELQDAKFIRKAINLSNETMNFELEISQDDLLKEIKERMTRRRITEEWIAWAVQKQYLVADEIGALARGGALISQLPRISDDKTYPKKAMMEMAKKNLIKAMFSRDYAFPLTNTEKFLTLWAAIKYKVKNKLKEWDKKAKKIELWDLPELQMVP